MRLLTKRLARNRVNHRHYTGTADPIKAEARRIQRGRQPSVQQGQGHGIRIYDPSRPGRRKWEPPRFGAKWPFPFA